MQGQLILFVYRRKAFLIYYRGVYVGGNGLNAERGRPSLTAEGAVLPSQIPSLLLQLLSRKFTRGQLGRVEAERGKKNTIIYYRTS